MKMEYSKITSFILLIATVCGLAACSWFKSPAVQAVLQPVTTAACTDETKALTALASSVATTLQCANQAQIVTDLTTALGNANVCAWSSATSTVSAQVVKPMGVVGNMVCPLASAAVVGFMTSAIPTTWGCTATTSAAAVQSALTQVCEAAVPI